MLAQALFTMLVTVPLSVLAQSVTSIDPAKTDAYFSAITPVDFSIISEYSSIVDEVFTLLPSSVYTDWESTEASFDLTSFATAAVSDDFAPWVTLLPSSIQGTFAAILTQQIVDEQSVAVSVLQNSSITGTPPSTQTGAGYSNNLAPSIPALTSSPSTFMSMTPQASANSVSSTSSHNAAVTGGVGMVQVAGVAIGAVAAVVAVL